MFSDIDFAFIAVQYISLLFALCFHEAAHAFMALRCGDDTAKLMGRTTLDPRAHVDPIGTIVMPLLMFVTQFPFLIGWAKPVPFNPARLNNMRRDPVLIAMAGPASNLLLGIAGTFVLRGVVLSMGINDVEVMLNTPAVMGLFYFTIINFALMLFNLLPIPPLDGHYVLDYYLPPRGKEMLRSIGPFGIIFIIMFGRHIIGPPLNLLLAFVAGFAIHGFGVLGL